MHAASEPHVLIELDDHVHSVSKRERLLPGRGSKRDAKPLETVLTPFLTRLESIT